MTAGFANSRLDRYEAVLAGKRAVLGQFAQRESEKKTSEAFVTIVSQLCLCGFLIAGMPMLPAIVKGVGIFAAFGFTALYWQEGATVGDFVICAGLLQRLFESVGSVMGGVVTIADERKYKKEFEDFLGAASGWHEGYKKCEMGSDTTAFMRI